jgi:ATP-binding cassette subfamily F protein uup
LPKLIEKLEAELASLQQLISTSEFYQQDQKIIAETSEKIKTLENSIQDAYKRWEELDACP